MRRARSDSFPRMAAVADGSASAAAAAAKEVEYQAGVQKLVDLLSKLNPAAKEFVPSSAAAASPPKKALSADAPVFDYHSIGAGNGGAKDSATDASFYIGSPQHRVIIRNAPFVLDSSPDAGVAWIGAVDVCAI